MYNLKKLDLPLYFVVFLSLVFIIYVIEFRGTREYKKPYWVNSEITSYSCRDSVEGVHYINVDKIEGNVLVAIKSLFCEDLKKLSQGKVQIKISYGYDNVAYSFEIKSDDLSFSEKNGEITFSLTKYFTLYEIFILSIVFCWAFSRIMGVVRRNREYLERIELRK
ncbi:hypothetical protein ABMY35_14420 [Pseudoalteromonas sp. BZB3]|uniref:hypothetical protein n=1 Tax=Pseudoalteromonas sp. BZB3 TaxID=3136670 RepID=UPI0032C3E495